MLANHALAMGDPVTQSIFTAKYDRFRLLMIGARRSAGLTQTELAEKLSRPQSFVSKYERGERRLDVVEFLEVAKALGVDPAGLIKELNGLHDEGNAVR
jgi:transcriptional regulator with XRE-family HTH domain